MTTKFNVGDKVYVEECFEMNYGVIKRIEITEDETRYYFTSDEQCGEHEMVLHKTEEEAFISMIKACVKDTSYYHRHNQKLENLRNELLEVIARYED